MRTLRTLTKLSVAAMFAFAVIVLASAGDADACAVCYGDPESPMTKGMAAGIWVLLGCIFTVLTGFASVFLYWMSRSRRLSALELVAESATH
jgi:hypothetical protein